MLQQWEDIAIISRRTSCKLPFLIESSVFTLRRMLLFAVRLLRLPVEAGLTIAFTSSE
jgi:hypothetical protein